jgi:hypothetical protein
LGGVAASSDGRTYCPHAERARCSAEAAEAAGALAEAKAELAQLKAKTE